MKYYFNYKNFLLFVLMLLLVNISNATSTGAAEIAVKLKSYKATFFADAREENIKDNDNSDSDEMKAYLDKTDMMFDDIDSTVSFLLKQKKWDQEVMRELIRISMMALENDPSQFAAELLAPLYQKDSKEFQEYMKDLSTEQQKKMLSSIKNFARVKKSGNG